MTELAPTPAKPGGRSRGNPAVPDPGNVARPAVVDGVDLDAVAAAVRGCPAIDDLSSGTWGGVVSYLPGRQIAGIRVASDHVVISVRGRWGFPVSEMAHQVRAAIGALVAPRRVNLVVAELAGAPGEIPAGGQQEEAGSWTTSSPGGAPAASSSAPITPTGAVTPMPSPPDSPPTTSAPRPPRQPG